MCEYKSTEQKRQYNRDYYRKNIDKMRECGRKNSSKYYYKNREKKLAQMKEYRSRPGYKEKKKVYMKKYFSDPINVEKYKNYQIIYQLNYRAKKDRRK